MAYLHPGVYIEEIPSGVRPIEGVGTSTAIFIGQVDKGPVACPELISKLDDYTSLFGGIKDTGLSATGDGMGLSVQAFFSNGGSKAYIARLAPGAVAASASFALPADTVLFRAKNPGEWANGLEVHLAKIDTPRGMTGNFYSVAIGRTVDDEFVAQEIYTPVSGDFEHPLFFGSLINDTSDLVSVTVTETDDDTEMTLPANFFLGTSVGSAVPAAAALVLSAADAANRTLSLALDGNAPIDVVVAASDYASLAALAAEIQTQVRTGAAALRRTAFTCAVNTDGFLLLTSGTRLPDSSVVVGDTPLALALHLGVANGGTEVNGEQNAQNNASWELTLADGTNGATPGRADYQALFTKLEKYRDVNIILLPDQQWSASGNAIVSDAIAHCQKMMNRMIIVDPPRAELANASQAEALALPTSTYSVAYYPWVSVTNPWYNAEKNPGVPRTVFVPPSAFAAGIWSKVDSRRGVWKAPAGVETSLLGVAGLEHVVEDAEQDYLNPAGINCLRKLPGFGSVVWGSRTLATRADPEWRYVPVRRTAIMIEESIFGGIQWAVFEPNDHRLWASLRVNISSFMNGLFRAGAFQGEKANDAYFVRCGLGDTMTQADIDRGQVIVVVGFAPLKPAEFVIVRIQQKVGQQ